MQILIVPCKHKIWFLRRRILNPYFRYRDCFLHWVYVRRQGCNAVVLFRKWIQWVVLRQVWYEVIWWTHYQHKFHLPSILCFQFLDCSIADAFSTGRFDAGLCWFAGISEFQVFIERCMFSKELPVHCSAPLQYVFSGEHCGRLKINGKFNSPGLVRVVRIFHGNSGIVWKGGWELNNNGNRALHPYMSLRWGRE